MRRIQARRKRKVYTRHRTYTNEPIPRLRAQMADVQKGNRGLVAHWFRMNVVPVQLPQPARNPRAQMEVRRMVRAFGKMGVTVANGSVVRVGFVPRQPREKSPIPGQVRTVNLPIAEGKFHDYLESNLGKAKDRGIKKRQKRGESFRKPTSLAAYEHLHARTTQIIGMSQLLEVGKGPGGEPTHILILKRPETLPIEPGTFHYGSGIIRKDQSPFKAMASRTAKEVGISPSEVSTIGPGLTPTGDEIVFTLHKMDKLACYSGIVIQRAHVPIEQVQQKVEGVIASGRKTRDPYSPVGYVLLPRTPAAIHAFVKSHPTIMPEVLRLYSRELTKAARR